MGNIGNDTDIDNIDTDNKINNVNKDIYPDDDLLGGTEMSPQAIVDAALRYMCPSVSFTYTEPVVYFEYALDAAKAAKAAGLRTVFVSNGFMTAECLSEIAPYLDACNIDLKSFREDFYKKYCAASLGPILESLKTIREAGIWLEITTLLITGLNDTKEELTDTARFISDELGADTPWHVSGFFPQYRMLDVPPTGVASIETACGIGADAGLRYVYGGNVGIFQDTRCHTCGGTVIRRRGYRTQLIGLTEDGRCGGCGERIGGVF